ncbi:MAG: TlpA family protein disulfide reductase [Acidobacteria bacterium]|nr:TlpA family protein disulfide reductase [Acidobacteriota bacterium]
MVKVGDHAPHFSLPLIDSAAVFSQASNPKPVLLIFFESDCPTCHLTIPYLNRLTQELGNPSPVVLGISQDDEKVTRELMRQLAIAFPVALDSELQVTKAFDPIAVPTLFLINGDGEILDTQSAFAKTDLNRLAAKLCRALNREPIVIAEKFDGNPDTKPGCTSRHLETLGENAAAPALNLYARRAARASRIALADEVDPYDYCMQMGFADALPVVPPTVERVERMLAATALPADEVIGLVAPNYGAATVEKIAANAVMAGCEPALMRVLIPLVRAVCDERFNLHGVQATTHFAAPLIIINGAVRKELGFACAGNVFSNIARANSSVGRTLQLLLGNLGGARPGEIDMSTLGNPGKFSYCIAENEEENPWEPLHVELGFASAQSAVTLFAAEPPRGVSEHNARHGKQILKAICHQLATSWTYRICSLFEALVVLCPEHVKTLKRDGFTKSKVREFLFNNTGIPLREYVEDNGEGTQYTRIYQEAMIDGERHYLKFAAPEQLKIIVAGGTAGKFSAVISSWATGARGSQMVTYPIAD